MSHQQIHGLKARNSPGRTKATKSPKQNQMPVSNTKSKKTTSCKMDQMCTCAKIIASPITFPEVWSELRTNNQLCDGVVKCEDGTEFNIHRAILASVSPYFKALFTNSINRNQPETLIAHTKAPGPVFNELLSYAYAGFCKIDHDNLGPLMRYADQYEVMGVLQLCCQYILDHLEPKNCLGLLRFARQYFCKRLELCGQNYIKTNFVDVVKVSKELVFLSFDELKQLLSDDDLNVKSEETTFEAVKKWIEYDLKNRVKYVIALLHTVRLGNLSNECLQNILQWPPIVDNTDCNFLINSALSILEIPKRELDIITNPLLRPRVPYDILFAIGGWTAGSPTNFIETYDIRANRWLLSRDIDKIARSYHGICELNGLIYIIGGFDGNEHFSSVRCYNPIEHKWKDCACMYYPRCYVSVATHAGKIYAMGGYNGRIRMSSVEKYDPTTNQWELIQPMHRQRSDASAATLNGKIYIVGGFNGTEVMNSAEVYDTTTNQWLFIPHMISARSGVSLIAHKDTLYALGGFNGFTRLTTAERYTPSTSFRWDSIADMFYPRSNFATVVLEEFIFAIGGFNDRFVAGSTTINHVEFYDVDSNQWIEVAPMNLKRSALSACVISGLPNAKDYSMHGRHLGWVYGDTKHNEI